MRYRLLLLLMAGLAACEPNADDAPSPSAGTANFSRYVAVGDDYTAGVYNGSLTRASQQYAFPNLLAQQLQRAGGGDFTQPLLEEGQMVGTGLSLVSLTDRNLPLLGPVAASSSDTVRFGSGACAELRYKYSDWSGAGAALPQNLGAPGLRLQDVAVAGIGNEANRAAMPYNAGVERLLPVGDNRSYLDLLKAAPKPTFFTVFMGLSDYLPYLKSGGTCGSIPSSSLLGARIRAVVDSLVKTGARGLVFYLPQPGTLPLTRNTLLLINKRLGRPDTASLYVQNRSGKARVLAKDVVLLPVVGRIGRNETSIGLPANDPLGSFNNPLRDEDVLTEAQINNVNSSIGIVNDVIKTYRTARTQVTGAVDINSKFFGLSSKGALFDGIRFDADVVTGGFFSFDGVTLTPRGNALLANWALEVINDNSIDPNLNKPNGFGAQVPSLDITRFPTTLLP